MREWLRSDWRQSPIRSHLCSHCCFRDVCVRESVYIRVHLWEHLNQYQHGLRDYLCSRYDCMSLTHFESIINHHGLPLNSVPRLTYLRLNMEGACMDALLMETNITAQNNAFQRCYVIDGYYYNKMKIYISSHPHSFLILSTLNKIIFKNWTPLGTALFCWTDFEH